MIATTRTLIALAPILLGACVTISSYDPISFKTATDLKAECLTLIEKSAESPPSQFEAEIAALQLQLRKAHEYEKGKALNSETAKQWGIMRDPNRDLMGGFIEKWKTKNTKLSKAYTGEIAIQITEGFATIIRLESGKRKKG